MALIHQLVMIEVSSFGNNLYYAYDNYIQKLIFEQKCELVQIFTCEYLWFPQIFYDGNHNPFGRFGGWI